MIGAAGDDDRVNSRYLNASRFTRVEIDAANKAADFWYYQTGVNAIPADTKIKKAWILNSWEDYQHSPLSLEIFEYWKQQGLFAYGIAVITGKIWRGDNAGKYLNLIDADNELAIQKLCSRDGKTISIQRLAEWTLVEQHKDNPNKAHIYIISTKPFPIKGSDKGKPGNENKIETNKIPGIEVKSEGGLSFAWNSMHKDGYRYEFVKRTANPVECDDYFKHINDICVEYDLKYLDNGSNAAGDIPIAELFKPDTVIYAGNNRHKQFLRICDSLIKRNKGILPLDSIKKFALEYNKGHNFSEPLEDVDVEAIWKQALGFIARNEEDGNNNQAPLELTISEALRIKYGYIKVKGQLIGQSTVYGMISAIGNITCWNCGTINPGKDYKKPVLSLKSELKTKKCLNCEESISTESAQEFFATVDVELQDPDRFSEIERLSVHLFENNTENIQVGEVVTIVGRIYMERKNDNGHNRPTPMLYGETIEYTRKEQSKLSEKDVEDIQKCKALKEEAGINPIDALVEMFAPHVIGNDDVKEGLLMTAANAGIPNEEGDNISMRHRLHQLLVGDPSEAKSTLLRAIVRLTPNAMYESAQSSTGLSLTAQVSKEEGGLHTLRLGPIPRSKGSICAINEIGQMPIQEHKHFLDCMEEGRFTLNKHGFNSPIAAHASIIATANPLGNTWKNPERIDNNEIPTLVQIRDRFDIISIFRGNRDPESLKDYVRKQREIEKNRAAGVYDNYGEFLKKYIMYARTFSPTISEEAEAMLDDFWIRLGSTDITGLKRRKQSLRRLIIARAKLKLKNIADVEEAIEVMKFYNTMLLHYQQTVASAKRPRDVAFEEYVRILKEKSKWPISLEDLAKTAGNNIEQVKNYVGLDFRLDKNKKLRTIHEMLLNHESIKLIQERPVVLQWMEKAKGNSNSNDDDNNNNRNDNSKQKEVISSPSALSDLSAREKKPSQMKNAQGSIVIVDHNDIHNNNNDIEDNNRQEARIQKESSTAIPNDSVEPCRSNNVGGSKWRSDRADRSDSKKTDYETYVAASKTKIDAAIDDNNNKKKTRHLLVWQSMVLYQLQ